jgi:ADP-ribose pyrophosphatase YjhB (NUDIX family)
MKKGHDFIGVAVVYFCHDGQGNILFAKRSQNSRDERGVWDVGGGALEFGETVEQCLKKEIKEEYNAEVLSFEFLGFRDVHRTHEGQPTHWVTLDFKVLIDPAGVKIGEPEKFDDIGWFKWDNMPSPVHSQFPAFLERHKNQLK